MIVSSDASRYVRTVEEAEHAPPRPTPHKTPHHVIMRWKGEFQRVT